MQPRLVESLRVRFFGRIQKRIVISDITDSLLPKTEDSKKDHLP